MTPPKKRDHIHLKRGTITSIETVIESDPNAHTVTIRTQGHYLPGEAYSLTQTSGGQFGVEVRSVQPIPNRDSRIVLLVATPQPDPHPAGPHKTRGAT